MSIYTRNYWHEAYYINNCIPNIIIRLNPNSDPPPLNQAKPLSLRPRTAATPHPTSPYIPLSIHATDRYTRSTCSSSRDDLPQGTAPEEHTLDYHLVHPLLKQATKKHHPFVGMVLFLHLCQISASALGALANAAPVTAYHPQAKALPTTSLAHSAS
jgi:hypothetical protein